MPPIASFKRSASDADWAGGGGGGAEDDDGAAKRLKPDPSKSNNAFTHVYLCIDRSGSMNSMDVAAANAGANNNAPVLMMTRYDAVFAAAAHLVELQKGKGIDFSLILWNDEAEWIFRNRTADESLNLLAEAKTSNPPRLGTNFSNCFKLLRECIVGADDGVTGKVKTEMMAKAGVGGDSNNSLHSSVVIFLSDGRPGDLRCHPPNQGEQIQPTYRRNKQTYDSVGGHLGALEPYLPPGTLHFVGIHESGYPWLQCLAERYNGTFHMSTLHFGQVNNGGGGGGGGGGGDDGQDGAPPAGDAMNNAVDGGADENEPGNQPALAAAAVAAGGANQENEGNAGDGGGNEDDDEEEVPFGPNVAVGNNKSSANDDGDDDEDDDDDLEFIEEVSVNERIRRNIANGEVISIASQSQSQSIMDTFSSLSQSISQYHESQQQSQDSDEYYDDDEDPYADDL